MSTDAWYWCLTHGEVEHADRRDDPDNALGPYATPDDARDWRRINEERAERWKADDEAWDGDEPEP